MSHKEESHDLREAYCNEPVVLLFYCFFLLTANVMDVSFEPTCTSRLPSSILQDGLR